MDAFNWSIQLVDSTVSLPVSYRTPVLSHSLSHLLCTCLYFSFRFFSFLFLSSFFFSSLLSSSLLSFERAEERNKLLLDRCFPLFSSHFQSEGESCFRLLPLVLSFVSRAAPKDATAAAHNTRERVKQSNLPPVMRTKIKHSQPATTGCEWKHQIRWFRCFSLTLDKSMGVAAASVTHARREKNF